MSQSSTAASSSRHWHTVYLGLGSNLGNREQYLRQAIAALGEAAGKVEQVSHFIETEPWGYQSAHTYVNACVRLNTTLSPHELLKATQQIERNLGRTHKTRNREYHDRVIDIDLLLYDDLHLSTPELTLPHPLMHERDFVMKPLNEIWIKK